LRISQRSIDEVREAANIVEVASEFTALRRQGTRFSGLCPYPDHQEKTPSFSVSPDRGFYYCFGCSKGGDAIKLVTDLKSFSFSESISYLADRSGVELEFEGDSSTDSEAAKKHNLRRRMVYKALAAAAIYYHKYLLKAQTSEAENARQYLDGRGLTISTIEEFRLGYAPPRGSSGFLQAARKFGIEREALDSAGLLSSRGGERFAGRITFPITDRRGRIVGFGARALGDDHPKYLNSPETQVFNKRELLYGFPQVTQAMQVERAALVVEGYTDVLMLYQAGIKNAVATLGTATTPAHLKTLSGYAERIYILFDPDAAGEKAIERAAETAAEMKLDLRVLRLPKDPADWLLEHQSSEFAEQLSGAVPVLEYIFRRKAEHARGAGAAERSRVLAEIKDLLGRIEDPVFHRDAIRIAAESLGVRPETLEKPGPLRTGAWRRQSPSAPQDPHLNAGRGVISLILARPDLTRKPLTEGVTVAGFLDPLKVSAGDFVDEDHARIFTVLEQHAGDDLDGVFSDERIRFMMDEVAALSSEGETLYPSEAAIREGWLRLAILSRQRAKRETSDFDVKDYLHSEIQILKDALRAVGAEA
jgi:DNA primase